jgi:hypothetical protein
MHSSDSDDNVTREIELAFNCVNERLVLSKTKQGITPEDFYNALKLYTGKYKLENIYGSFSLEEYHKDNDIDPGFFCFDENDNDFAADVLLVEDSGGTHIRVIGENQAGKILSRAFDDFDVFVEDVLDRYGEHRDDTTTGEEHLQNIYDILIKNQ